MHNRCTAGVTSLLPYMVMMLLLLYACISASAWSPLVHSAIFTGYEYTESRSIDFILWWFVPDKGWNSAYIHGSVFVPDRGWNSAYIHGFVFVLEFHPFFGTNIAIFVYFWLD